MNEFKIFNKAFKQNLFNHHKVVPGTLDGSLIKPSTAILQRTYYQGKSADLLENQNFRSDLDAFSDYKKASLMAPILYIMALAAVNRHEGPSGQDKPKKPLKIVIYDDIIMKFLDSGQIKTSGGVYTHRSSIYAGKNRSESIYHEAGHMVAKEIMQNGCSPYPRNSNKEAIFDKVVTDVQSALPNIKPSSAKEQTALSALSCIYDQYAQSQWAIELIVKVPEILSILGYDEGLKWLKENTPSLLDYYEKHFQPTMIQYLARNNAEQYLELSDDFKSVLESVKRKEHLMGAEMIAELRKYGTKNNISGGVQGALKHIVSDQSIKMIMDTGGFTVKLSDNEWKNVLTTLNIPFAEEAPKLGI